MSEPHRPHAGAATEPGPSALPAGRASGPGIADEAPPGTRRPIGRPAPRKLPFELRAEADGDGVLLIAHDERLASTFVRRIDATGALGPVRSLEARPVASFGGLHPQLVTSESGSLCVEPMAGPSATTARRCVEAAPLAVVALADGVRLIEQLPEPAEKEDATGAAPREKRGASGPESTRIGVRLIPPTGPIPSQAEETGLSVRWPMPGMDLVAAVPTTNAITLAWYEHLRFVGRGRRQAEAELRAGVLDATGKFVRSSRVRLFGGKREYGFIEGHLEPRLVARDGGSAFVGRTVDPKSRTKRFGYEARRLSPSRKLDPAANLCRIDPAALARSQPPTPEQLAVLEAIAERRPELAPGQPRSEIGQVAWTAQRGYFVAQEELVSVDRASGQMQPLDWPFTAHRVRVRGAGLGRLGDAVVLTTDRLVMLAADGAIEERASPAATDRDGAARLDQPAEGEGFAAAKPVRVGACWWRLARRSNPNSSAWMLRPVEGCGAPATPPDGSAPPPSGAASTLHLAPSLSALVGGELRGMLLRVRFDNAGRGWLDVDAVAPDGGLARLASHRAPATSGIVAVERAGGGAIAAGRSALDPTRVVGFAIGPTGALLGAQPIGLEAAPPSVPLELWPLPRGGALVANRDGSHLGWLDDSGHELTTRHWPADRARANCLDGRPARRWVPTQEPGRLISVPELGRDGTCVVGQPQWAGDGSLRWVGTRQGTLDSVAEVGMLHFAPTSTARASAAPTGSTNGSVAGEPSAPRGSGAPEPATPARALPCPPDMVLAGALFCIDRYEARLGDLDWNLALSPDWPATPGLTRAVLSAWTTGRWRTGDLHAQAHPLPPLLRTADSSPAIVARNEPGVLPSGYVTGLTANLACRAAGKRLCTADEFRVACRGQEDRAFPYGDSYEHGACNVFRDTHPAGVLHGNAAVGHLDPRLNRVLDGGAPLRRPTGASARCRSRWGDDYVYDLVGNLDEWLDEPKGAFAGGFYARATRSGCDAVITAHPRRYLDYSTGARCCLDASLPPGAKPFAETESGTEGSP